MDYQEFRALYEETHPASVPKEAIIESRFSREVGWVTLVLFVFTALASGVHTIPIVEAGIPASSIPQLMITAAVYGSFVAVELALMLSAFLMNHDRTKYWAYAMFGVSASAAIAANILSVQSAFAANDAEQHIAVVVLFGVVFPLGALISGIMFVEIKSSERTIARHIQEKFDADSVAWDDKILRAYNNVNKPAKQTHLIVEDKANGRDAGHGYRRGGGVQTVLAAVAQDPSLAMLSVRPLAERIGNVSSSTVGNAFTHEQKQHIAAGSMVIVHDGEKYVIQEVQ